jgi:hypothetical protein
MMLGGGHTADTVVRGHERIVRQTVMVLREQACKKAVTPGTSTTASLAIRLVLSCSAAMFQVPVTTRTAKAGRHLIEPACHSKRDLRSQARCQIEATPGGKRASAHAGRN